MRFDPISLGGITAGSFTFVFDASDVELTGKGENIDALASDTSGAFELYWDGSAAGMSDDVGALEQRLVLP